jgi:hypothetical protein
VRANGRKAVAVVGVSVAVLAIYACRRDLTQPAAPVLEAPPVVAGGPPELALGDSPDQFTLALRPVDSVYGASSTAPGSGFRVIAPTVMHVTATGIVTKRFHATVVPPRPDGYLYPGGGQTSVRYRRGVNNNGFQFPSGGASVQTYFKFFANDTVTGADRAGAGNESSYGVFTNPDGSPHYCGPAYGSWCWVYSGDPGTITFRRLDASLSLTVDSASAKTGSTVRFTLRAVPEVVEGQTMPIQVDSVAWVPADDSLGGDYSEATRTSACGFSGSPLSCTRLVIGSGTLEVTAHVNGKRMVVSKSIEATPRPKITGRPYVKKGTSSSYTASISDGSTPTIWSWGWAADPGAGSPATTFSCSSSVNPCPYVINQSGFPIVTVVINGKKRSTRMHVTAWTSFTLDVDPPASGATFYVGDTAVFRPKVDGQSAMAMQWRWVSPVAGSSDAAVCSPAFACTKSLPEPGTGTMWAYIAGASGGMDSASRSVTIRDDLLVNCHAAGDANIHQVTRGATIVCDASLRSGGPFTVTKAEATPSGFGKVLLNAPSGAVTSWSTQGGAAVSTSVTVSYASQTSGDGASAFTVVPRTDFPTPQFGEPLVEPKSDDCLRPRVTANVCGTLYSSIVLSLLPRFFLRPALDQLEGVTTSVQDGPNKGLSYLTSLPLDRPLVYVNDDFNSTTSEWAASWKADQNGTDGTSDIGVKNGVEGPYCKQADIPTILADAKRHEGVGLAPNSHLGQFNNKMVETRAGDRFERHVFRSTDSNVDLRFAVKNLFDVMLSEWLNQLVQTFDQQEDDSQLNRWHCVGDYNPENP